jgi:hypothetical protein
MVLRNRHLIRNQTKKKYLLSKKAKNKKVLAADFIIVRHA